MTAAANHAILEEMERDPLVIMVGEGVGKSEAGGYGIAKGLYSRFGESRVLETPICEETIIALAVGAAAGGFRPIAQIWFMDLIALAMDPVCNQAGTMRYLYGEDFKLPLVIDTLCGGGSGIGAHHNQSLEAWFVHTPGLKVVMPSNPYDAKGLMTSAIRDDDPVFFLRPRALMSMQGEVPSEEYVLPLGKAEVKRTGRDVTVVAIGAMINIALGAANRLAQDNLSIEVVDPMTLSPLDEDTILNSVRKTGRLVIVHEARKPCGFGAEIASLAAEKAIEYLEAPIKRVTAPFIPVPAGPSEAYYRPSEDNIIEAIREIM
jgi:pyruvate dehydrogenase E1 component beta subunit